MKVVSNQAMHSPAGLPIEMHTIDIWRIEDGRFVEHWDELNALQLFQQIGVLPRLGETKEAK